MGRKKCDLQKYKACNRIFESGMQAYIHQAVTTRACASQSCHFQAQQMQLLEVFSALTHGFWIWHINADVWATYALIYSS